MFKEVKYLGHMESSKKNQINEEYAIIKVVIDKKRPKMLLEVRGVMGLDGSNKRLLQTLGKFLHR